MSLFLLPRVLIGQFVPSIGCYVSLLCSQLFQRYLYYVALALLLGVLPFQFGALGKHRARSALRLFFLYIGPTVLKEYLHGRLVP